MESNRIGMPQKNNQSGDREELKDWYDGYQTRAGYVDFIFYPSKANDDCLILELKVDHTAEEAIQQIKKRNYALKFQEKLGEKIKYRGWILAVGIAYSKKDKKHDCKIEVLRERL